MNYERQHTESGNSPPEQTELEVAVQAAYTDWKNALASARKTTLEFARELGTLLIQMKAETDHRNWLSALQRCGLSIRKAQRFMRIAGADASTLSHLTSVHQAEVALAKPNRAEEQERADRRNARVVELEAGIEASPDLIEKWRDAWASLNVTETEVEEVERAVETWQESIRILYAVRQRVLDVYPKRAPQSGSAQAIKGNLDGIGKAFRFLFETGGVGDGNLAAPSQSG